MLASSCHLPGKSYWVTHHHMRWACLQTVRIQPMLKIARIRKPLPIDCLFPSHKGFGSLPSSLAANSTQLNITTSLLSMLGHLADTAKTGLPLRACSELLERLTLANTGLGSNSTPSYQATTASSRARNKDADSPTRFYTTDHSCFTLGLPSHLILKCWLQIGLFHNHILVWIHGCLNSDGALSLLSGHSTALYHRNTFSSQSFSKGLLHSVNLHCLRL